MDYVGMDKAVIVGNSMGGAIALYIAIYYPERVEKLVLTDSAGIKTKSWLEEVIDLASPTTLKMIGITSGAHYKGNSPKQKARREFSRSFKGTKEELPYLKAMEKAIKQTASINLLDKLCQIQAPTLIIWGDDDPVGPVEIAYIFDENIPNSQLYVVEKTGHTPMMEKPKEFNCVLEAFLQGGDLESCRNLEE